ncbi:MAG: hypothetical protein ACREC6_05515 [Hyphomicrobiaceae bacterium]
MPTAVDERERHISAVEETVAENAVLLRWIVGRLGLIHAAQGGHTCRFEELARAVGEMVAASERRMMAAIAESERRLMEAVKALKT